ncbi:glucose-1-phosphate cytidylyltransferase [Fibrobacteria bacterium R8-3-H12]
MKVVILAGGLGTRLSEETELKPKPMVEIGGRPILWHIMKIYSHFGFNDFIVLTGYKSHLIKEYFLDYYARYSDLTIDMQSQSVEMHKARTEPWNVTMLYTGADTQTGGRLFRAKDYLKDEPFMLTYGDGVGNINIAKLLDFHKASDKIVTVTAVQPKGRYGVLTMDKAGLVESFQEKPNDSAWISGGFFVMQPQIFDYLKNDDRLVLEHELDKVAQDGKLQAYKHSGFWQPMDTLKDKISLTDMWMTGHAPWAMWL